MKRIDTHLVDAGLAPSRAKAQQMVRAGEVEVFHEGTWRAVKKVSEPAAEARVTGVTTLRFVSRGGLKLDAALDRVGLDVRGFRVLDLGQSTGGFTDCVLQRGAAAVLGADVGHGQLHPRLRGDARVTVLEGTHARELAAAPGVRGWLAGGVDLVVADLSFISITRIIPVLSALMPSGCRALVLIKPQFEAGPESVSRRGLVTDARIRDDVVTGVRRASVAGGFEVTEDFACAVKGQDGNQEYFASLRRI